MKQVIFFTMQLFLSGTLLAAPHENTTPRAQLPGKVGVFFRYLSGPAPLKVTRDTSFFAESEDLKQRVTSTLGGGKESLKKSLETIRRFAKGFRERCAVRPTNRSAKYFADYIDGFVEKLVSGFREADGEIFLRDRLVQEFKKGVGAYLATRQSRFSNQYEKYTRQDGQLVQAVNELANALFVPERDFVTRESPLKEAVYFAAETDEPLCLAEALTPDGVAPKLICESAKLLMTEDEIRRNDGFRFSVDVEENGSGLRNLGEAIFENSQGERLSCSGFPVVEEKAPISGLCDSRSASAGGRYFFKGFAGLKDYADNLATPCLDGKLFVDIPDDRARKDRTPPALDFELAPHGKEVKEGEKFEFLVASSEKTSFKSTTDSYYYGAYLIGPDGKRIKCDASDVPDGRLLFKCEVPAKQSPGTYRLDISQLVDNDGNRAVAAAGSRLPSITVVSHADDKVAPEIFTSKAEFGFPEEKKQEKHKKVEAGTSFVFRVEIAEGDVGFSGYQSKQATFRSEGGRLILCKDYGGSFGGVIYFMCDTNPLLAEGAYKLDSFSGVADAYQNQAKVIRDGDLVVDITPCTD